jgi:hypothetical protein
MYKTHCCIPKAGLDAVQPTLLFSSADLSRVELIWMKFDPVSSHVAFDAFVRSFPVGEDSYRFCSVMPPYGLGGWCGRLLETCCLHSQLDPEDGGTAIVRNVR